MPMREIGRSEHVRAIMATRGIGPDAMCTRGRDAQAGW